MTLLPTSPGWVGVLVVLTFSAAAAYTASLIGRCWTIVCERHEEYRDKQVGHPYPLIGELAFGRSCRWVEPCSWSLAFWLYLEVLVGFLERDRTIPEHQPDL